MEISNDLKFAVYTVDFNTPEYIIALNSSIRKHNKWFIEKLKVFENSTIDVSSLYRIPQLEITPVDKTIFKELDALPKSKYFIQAGNYNSARHTKTLDWILKNSKEDCCLLLDSDVIIRTDFKNLLEEFVTNDYFLMGYERTSYIKPCISPWACFINLKRFRELNLNYFDFNRILYVNDNLSYDTGASFFEDAKALKLKIKTLPDNSFYYHFKGGSVFKNKGLTWLKQHKHIWS